MLVGGERVEAKGGGRLDVIDPGSGVVFAQVPEASCVDADRAVAAARAAFVGINVRPTPEVTMPTGGYKQSGWGREVGLEGLDAFLESPH